MHISSHTGYLTLKQNGETELSSVHLDAVCCMIFFFFPPPYNPVSLYDPLRNTRSLWMPTVSQIRPSSE